MIETSRLLIIPLSAEELDLYVKFNEMLERKLQLAVSGRTVMPEIKKRVQEQILPMMNGSAADAYLFFTFWLAVEKMSRIIVAELGFKGGPDENAEIEIGYATYPEHRGKGYMTEAIQGICNWVEGRAEVRGINAETEESNKASIGVLQKNKFILFGKKNRMLWWKKYAHQPLRP
jgi:ribosomal-protein-alanine N-acetyltransferase